MNQLWTSFILFLLIFFSMSSAFALREKTFARDNTFCRIEGKRIEFELRGHEKYTDPQEAEIGDQLFAVMDHRSFHLPLHGNLTGRHRLLRGQDKNCSKSLSLKLNRSTLALFLLKENRPFADTLSVVIFDARTRKAHLVPTSYPVREARIRRGRLEFGGREVILAPKMGKTKINGQELIYLEKKLERWWQYDGKKFEPDIKLTQAALEKQGIWPELAQTIHDTYLHAIDHSSKEQCFLVAPYQGAWTCHPEKLGPKHRPQQLFLSES